jgi:hypothetical protein
MIFKIKINQNYKTLFRKTFFRKKASPKNNRPKSLKRCQIYKVFWLKKH